MYMSADEVLVFGLCLVLAVYLSFVWFKAVFKVRSFNNNVVMKLVFGILPFVSSGIILTTIFTLGDPSVLYYSEFIYAYLFMGITWKLLGLSLLFYYLDISWRDDAIYNENPAALWSVVGAVLGMTLIYSGANIGEGPGWWCVVFAGGLGMTAYFKLLKTLNKWTDFSERITIDRDLSCGIRIGALMTAMGIILGRASAGDWTSFLMTIYEFLVGWPVLILVGIALFIETIFKKDYSLAHSKIGIAWAIVIGIAYLIFAILTVIMLPTL